MPQHTHGHAPETTGHVGLSVLVGALTAPPPPAASPLPPPPPLPVPPGASWEAAAGSCDGAAGWRGEEQPLNPADIRKDRYFFSLLMTLMALGEECGGKTAAALRKLGGSRRVATPQRPAMHPAESGLEAGARLLDATRG